MLGGASRAYEQAVKWGQARYQFQRPLADFELVRAMVARMSAYNYAMDAVLYATTGMLDRHDDDIMLETAICKVVCSEFGWQVVNDAMQIMGGEGYMTENVVERIFRDSRINLIVEGANEVMRSFIFAYGGKQLAERLLGVQQAVGWDHHDSIGHNLTRIYRGLKRPGVARAAASLGAEVFLGVRGAAPSVHGLHAELAPYGERLGQMAREHRHAFIQASRQFGETIITRQCVQARVADSAIWLHAWACVLSKLDRQLARGESGTKFESDKTAAIYFMDMAHRQAREALGRLFDNDDGAMLGAAAAALAHVATLPDEPYSIPEASPVARGPGRRADQSAVRQFPGDAKCVAGPTAEARLGSADGAGAAGGNGQQQHSGEPHS
jgi:acyl-CoA dehydrogenase family protein 9